MKTGSDSVDLWRVSLAMEPDRLDHLSRSLDQVERRRAAGFQVEPDRHRFVAIRGIAREVLAAYLGRPPRSLRFEYEAHGKPFLPDHPDLRFNLSHAADRLLVAVARGRSVGVDIERVPRQEVVDTVGRRVFSTPERMALQEEQPAARPDLFARLWTRKEAYIKADGRGMSLPFMCVDVSTSPDRVLLLEEASGRWLVCPEWTLRPVPVAPGYYACLAAQGGNWTLGCFDWEEGC